MSLVLSACYSLGGYQPTVDAYGDKNAYRINQDMAECRQLAEQAAGGGTGKETLIGDGVGGLIGAAAGAAIGAAAGNPGMGAAIGAGAATRSGCRRGSTRGCTR